MTLLTWLGENLSHAMAHDKKTNKIYKMDVKIHLNQYMAPNSEYIVDECPHLINVCKYILPQGQMGVSAVIT